MILHLLRPLQAVVTAMQVYATVSTVSHCSCCAALYHEQPPMYCRAWYVKSRQRVALRMRGVPAQLQLQMRALIMNTSIGAAAAVMLALHVRHVAAPVETCQFASDVKHGYSFSADADDDREGEVCMLGPCCRDGSGRIGPCCTSVKSGLGGQMALECQKLLNQRQSHPVVSTTGDTSHYRSYSGYLRSILLLLATLATNCV
jgi:hypothetical protein